MNSNLFNRLMVFSLRPLRLCGEIAENAENSGQGVKKNGVRWIHRRGAENAENGKNWGTVNSNVFNLLIVFSLRPLRLCVERAL